MIFVQSSMIPTLSGVNAVNMQDIQTVSHLGLDTTLNEVLSSINEENEDGELIGSESGKILPKGASFAQMMDSLQNKETISYQKTLSQFSSTLNGDYLSSFKIEHPTPADKMAEPKGMASRGIYREYSSEGDVKARTIDKTSVLYEKALEMESYFVKIMMQSMRATLSGKTLMGEESFASKMYKDMMYDELNRTVTKNAGFGLADHIYLQLYRENSKNE